MQEKKILNISFLTFLLILTILIIIGIFCYICIKKANSNKEIAKLETKAIDMQKTVDELQEKNNVLSDNSNSNKLYNQENEDTIKILVERHNYFRGMPGPNGGNKTGTSKFIASNGCIYEYEYDEYSVEKTSYPNTKKIEELSKDLINKATKTEKKLTDEELELIKEYIESVEKGKESIKEVKSSKKEILQPADAITFETFRMYNYASGKFMEINPEIEGGIFYESPSITKLFNIVSKYI